MSISERNRAILDFEQKWWTLPGPKELAIRDHLGLSATRYYKALNDLMDSPDAAEYDPLVIRRLRLKRDRRRRARYVGPASGRPQIR